MGRRRAGRRAGRRRAKLGSHGTRPESIRKSGCSYSPRVAVAECFRQRPSCLLNQPLPACLQWGPVVSAHAQGGRAPLLKAPALTLCLSTSCLGLPPLCYSELRGGSRGLVCLEQGPSHPRGRPWSEVAGGLEKKNYGPSGDTVAQVGTEERKQGGHQRKRLGQRLGLEHRGLSQSLRRLGPPWRWELKVGQAGPR